MPSTAPHCMVPDSSHNGFLLSGASGDLAEGYQRQHCGCGCRMGEGEERGWEGMG